MKKEMEYEIYSNLFNANLLSFTPFHVEFACELIEQLFLVK